MSWWIIGILAVGYLLVGLISWSLGYGCGRNREWCDQFFAKIAKDKARRDAKGQFKAKEARTV